MRIGSLAITDFRERTTNALIRLLGCSDRSVPLLFACNKTRLYVFSMGPVLFSLKMVSEYDQEIPQSQTADNPVAP